jgi:antiviral helicase SKI2
MEKYELYNEMNYLKNKINDIDYNTYIFNSLKNILNFLNEYNYITNYNNLDSLSKDNITLKGIICSQINECNEILLSEMLLQDYFDDLDDKQICGLLSVFCNTKCLNDDMKVYNVDILDIDDLLKNKLKKLELLKNDFQKKEENIEIFINTEWELNFDMVEYNYKWCNGDSFNSLNFDNYIGNFIKDVLKLDNLLCTLEVLCTNLEKYDLYNKLINIHSKILRDIVTSESLYIKM